MFEALEHRLGRLLPVSCAAPASLDYCHPDYALATGALAVAVIVEAPALLAGSRHGAGRAAAEPDGGECATPVAERTETEPSSDQGATPEAQPAAAEPGSAEPANAEAPRSAPSETPLGVGVTPPLFTPEPTPRTAAGEGVPERDDAAPGGLATDPELRAMLAAAAADAAALALRLAATDPTRLPTDDLIAVVEAWRKVEAAAAAQVRYTAAALAERPEMNPPALARRSANGCLAGDELATTLGISRRAAGGLVSTGQAFTGPLADVGHALATGAIDSGKATLYSDALADLPVPVVLAVVDSTLPQASSWPHHTLKRKLRDAATTASGADAAELHRHAAKGRHLRRPEPLPDGMAKLVAILPAPDAQTIWTVCDAAAWSARATGADPRTLEQLRADNLALLAEHTLATGYIGAPGGAEDDTAGEPHRPDGTAAEGEATGSPGGSDLPAGTPDVAASAPEPTTRASGPTIRTPEPTSASPDSATGMADVAASGGDARTAGSVDDAPAAPFAPGSRDLPTVRLGRPGRSRPAIQVVVAATTLLGLNDHPALLAGYGAIDASTARCLALTEDAPWARILTDPATGALLDLSPYVYRVPDALARHVRARDRHCVVPGCAVPSDRCDIDHVIPFPLGLTTADNLAPLCRRHHLLKTHCAYLLTRDADGGYLRSTPFGRDHTAAPEPQLPDVADVDPAFDDGTAPSGRSTGREPPPRPPDPEDPPPF